jgi:hypothetical protein
MEQERIVYETLKGRVTDIHWWRVKQAMASCELPMNKEGFELFINLRKTSPRYYSQYHKVKAKLSKEIEPQIGQGLTGKQFVELLEQLQIKPNQSTISRWFVRAGGFKAKAFYNKTVLLPIAAMALIYQAKNQSSQLAKVS